MKKNAYPRPQLEREKWLSLNGKWKFTFDDKNEGLEQKWYLRPSFNKQIEVPFAFQTKLSGIHDLKPHDTVWYHRTFNVPDAWKGSRILIHFGAVDYESKLFVNGQLVGHHIGGHDSFSYDITAFLNGTDESIVVFVYDPTFEERIPRGKQAWTEQHHGIWYPRTTGIWQTVWLEPVAPSAIESIRLTPDIDSGIVSLALESFNDTKKDVKISIFDGEECIVKDTYQMNKKINRDIQVWTDQIFKTNLHHQGKTWSPENPFLYDVLIEVLIDDVCVDQIRTYFGMRKIHKEHGIIYLNNRPYYLKLVLDQGYYKDSLLTAPDDEALIKDIQLAKQMGFNGCRKHQKIEEERFLYHADKLGYLVWEELPSTASFDVNYHGKIIKEWTSIVKRDYNHPSIIAWVVLNESWGVPDIDKNAQQQDYAMSLYYLTKSLDPARLIVSNDGWEQVKTDICAIHNYCHGAHDQPKEHQKFKESLATKEQLLNHFPAGRNIYAHGYEHQGEPILLTEFGGISFATEEKNGWGYSQVNSAELFLIEYQRILESIHNSNALSGFCYTQLTDVEQEINGLLSYGRKPKVAPEKIKKINDRVSFFVNKKRS